MKMRLLAVAIPALFMASSAMAAEGETSTITFTGNIVQATCSLSDESKGLSVVLGDVAANTFATAGSSTVARPFTIKLDDCAPDTYQNASITFTGSTADDDGHALTTDAFGTTGVGIQILQGGSPLVVDGSGVSTQQALATGENELNFEARYVAVNHPVQAGTANGSAQFTVNYN